MSTISSPARGRSSTGPSPAHRSARATLNHWFYPFAGLVLLAMTVLGFQHFYFQGRAYPGRPIEPSIRALVIAHGVTMSAWIILFAIQPLLVGLRKRKLHMALGRAGAVVAVLVVVLGLMLAVAATRATPPEVVRWGLPPARFMVVPLASALIFGLCVGVGIWKRRRPETHRAAMLLGTLATFSAAAARIDPLNQFYRGTAMETQLGPFVVSLLVGGALVALRCVLARRIERPLVLGYAGLVLASWLIIALGRTEAWMAFANLVAG